MNTKNLELEALHLKSTVYTAIKTDFENGCLTASEDYCLAVFNYINKVYTKKASLGTTDNLNYALGYDTNNSDLISVMTIHYIKAWDNLIKNYNQLRLSFPNDNSMIIQQFNKIVSSIHVRKEIDLLKHVSLSSVEQDEITGKTKRTYKGFKPNYAPLYLDEEQNSKTDDETFTLYALTPASTITTEDLAISTQTIMDITRELVFSPRLLLAFLSQYGGTSQWDIIEALTQGKLWTNIYADSLDQFCQINECASLKQHLSDIFLEDELTYTGSSLDIYAALSNERTKAKKTVIEYALANGLYAPSKRKYAHN